MSQISTKDRILDAAEVLFARDGFHFASMRSITTEAQANLAAVNYHFGSKEALLEEDAQALKEAAERDFRKTKVPSARSDDLNGPFSSTPIRSITGLCSYPL